jgi:hypothetical protein
VVHVEVANNGMVVFILCQIQLLGLGECVVGDVEAAGKGISEEEGAKPLMPSSTMLGAFCG